MKRTRPWDRLPPVDSKKPLSDKSILYHRHENNPPPVPYILIDGTKFYSDRFYLHKSVWDQSDEGQEQSTPCTCGAKQPPPLLDRERLVSSLDLQAAIFGTYTLDTKYFRRAFASLFDQRIPTLILQGRKSDALSHPTNDDDQDSVLSQEEVIMHQQTPVETFPSPQFHTQDESIMSQARKSVVLNLFQSPGRSVSGDEESGWPDHVHVSTVKSVWIPPRDRPRQVPYVNRDGSGSLNEAWVRAQVYKKGVHHPKFMILLEKCGSIVVVVSTANLVATVTTDASWIQRFPARTTATQSRPGPSSILDGSDLGQVLSQFLLAETWATTAADCTPLGFVQKYLQWKSLQALSQRFDFSASQVHLVPTVPGEYEVPPAAAEQNSRVDQDCQEEATSFEDHFLCGRDRVAAVLRNITNPSPRSLLPWFPEYLLHDDDHLLIQPTSFGAHWTVRKMANVVRAYMNLPRASGRKNEHQSSRSDEQVLERLQVVWPSEDFMQSATRKRPMTTPPHSGQSAATVEDSDSEELRAYRLNQGFVFLSSQAFNSIDLSCLGRMIMYEPSRPLQQRHVLIPHFKCLARRFAGKSYRFLKDHGFGKCESIFSWFLLTSSCLSLGAQGDELPIDPAAGRRGPTVSYANFELGVLFCSRVQGQPGSDRLYCWQPNQCSCDNLGGSQNQRLGSKQAQLIHLPIPFCLNGSPYQEDDEEVLFCETPYFHEILPGTATAGNMLLTPYGNRLVEKLE
jgi:Tyrosyl-DNA phosphodiesterase